MRQTLAAILMKYLISSILIVFFSSCNRPVDTKTKTNVLRRADPADTVSDTFRYKEIFEGTIDTIQEKEIPGFFGIWKITAIADVGGTILEEKKIRSQIGKKLILTKDSIWKNFLNDTSFVKNPEYSLEYIKTDDDGNDLRQTTYASGYRDCRKYVIFLTSTDLQIEIIHFAEIAYYLDGRIYFYSKQDAVNTAANGALPASSDRRNVR